MATSDWYTIYVDGQWASHVKGKREANKEFAKKKKQYPNSIVTKVRERK